MSWILYVWPVAAFVIAGLCVWDMGRTSGRRQAEERIVVRERARAHAWAHVDAQERAARRVQVRRGNVAALRVR